MNLKKQGGTSIGCEEIRFKNDKIGKIDKIEKIPFPVLKINLKLLWKNVKHLVEEVFDQRAGSGGNNSISCLTK